MKTILGRVLILLISAAFFAVVVNASYTVIRSNYIARLAGTGGNTMAYGTAILTGHDVENIDTGLAFVSVGWCTQHATPSTGNPVIQLYAKRSGTAATPWILDCSAIGGTAATTPVSWQAWGTGKRGH